jgi:ribA/ribD-fused uncharacterized protein
MIDKFDDEYRFLSNFYPAQVYYNQIWYPSVEHAYQAQKTLDETERYKISAMRSAGAAKRAGAELKLRKDWHDVSLGIMYDLVKMKFQIDDSLCRMLLATGDQSLIEGNTWGDEFWGKCKGKGLNHLGKILMRVRSELKENNG